MRKKYLAVTLGMILAGAAAMAGCSGNTTATSSTETASDVSELSEIAEETGELTSYKSQTIYGEVEEVNGSKLTFNIGEKTAGSDELSLTGESVTVEVPDAARISRSRGGRDGQMPDGEMPEMPDGEAPQDMGQGGPGGQMPDGEPPEMPDGEAPQDMGQGGPGGQMPDGEPPEMPDGEMPGEASDSIELTLDDISAGDTVAVTFDEDGNVTAIEIQGGFGMPGGTGLERS